MPTPLIRRRATPRLVLRPGPQLVLILVLSLMVVAAGINRIAPAAAPIMAADIASP